MRLGIVVGTTNPLLGSLLSLVISGFLTVFTSAVLVDNFDQPSAGQESPEDVL